MRTVNIFKLLLLMACMGCTSHSKQQSTSSNSENFEQEVETDTEEVEELEEENNVDIDNFDIYDVVKNGYYYTDKENELLIGNVYSVTEEYSYTESSKMNNMIIVKTFTPYGFYDTYLKRKESMVAHGADKVKLEDNFSRFIIEGRIINYFNAPYGTVSPNFSVSEPFIDVKRADVLVNVEAKFGYDSSLRWVKNGDYLGYKYEYNDEGYLIERTKNDLPMLQMNWKNSLISSIKIYDSQGNEVQAIRIAAIGNQIGISEGVENLGHFYSQYTFDGLGKILKIEQFRKRNPSPILVCFTTFEYNDGRIIKEYQRKRRDERTDIWDEVESSMDYDDIGNILSIFIQHSKKDLEDKYLKYEYQYDERGNWIQKRCYKIIVGDIEVKNKEYEINRNIKYYE